MDFEQLRQLRLSQHEMDTGDYDASKDVLTWSHIRIVRTETSLILLISFFIVLGILMFGLGKAGKLRLEQHLRERHTLIFGNYPGSAFTSTTVLGIALVTINAVVSLLQCVTERESLVAEHERRGLSESIPVTCEVRAPTFTVFFLEVASLCFLWSVLYRGNNRDQFSVAAVILYFLPSFYDFVGVLDGNSSKLVTSIKVLIFLHSLLFSIGFWYPYIMREMEKAKKNLEGSTAEVLSRRRAELAEIRRLHGRKIQ